LAAIDDAGLLVTIGSGTRNPLSFSIDWYNRCKGSQEAALFIASQYLPMTELNNPNHNISSTWWNKKHNNLPTFEKVH
jgi:hypothetical protein